MRESALFNPSDDVKSMSGGWTLDDSVQIVDVAANDGRGRRDNFAKSKES